MFVPVNKSKVHWVLMVIDSNKHTVFGYDFLTPTNIKKYTVFGYDSLGSTCQPYGKMLLKFLKQEHHLYFNDTNFPYDWKYEDIDDAPRQKNTDDCGVFVCMYTYFLFLGMDVHK